MQEVMNTYQKGKEAFESGLYCAESVLKVITDEEGIDSPLLPGIATGLCSGISRTCNLCGALTGGILALGAVFGRKSPDDSQEQTYKAVQQLLSDFEKEFGSTNCYELIQCDLGTEEGQQKFSDNNLKLNCGEYTGRAAEMVRNIINSFENS
jgi:C_GCAxxG_C_C family probable redox protein